MCSTFCRYPVQSLAWYRLFRKMQIYVQRLYNLLISFRSVGKKANTIRMIIVIVALILRSKCGSASQKYAYGVRCKHKDLLYVFLYWVLTSNGKNGTLPPRPYYAIYLSSLSSSNFRAVLSHGYLQGALEEKKSLKEEAVNAKKLAKQAFEEKNTMVEIYTKVLWLTFWKNLICNGVDLILLFVGWLHSPFI